MNFFLDTNILFKDPFLLNNYNKQLLELVRMNLEITPDIEILDELGLEHQYLDEIFKIYISKVVYEEAKNHYLKKVRDRFKQLTEINKDISWYMGIDEKAAFTFSMEDVLNRFDNYYDELKNIGIVTILDPQPQVMDDLLSRAILKKEPFFSNEKNEFRDAVLWLTYANYVEENDLENCYLITDNVTDFCLKKDREKRPTPIHPDLLKDSDKFTMYRSVQGLFIADREFSKRSEEYNKIKLSEEDIEIYPELKDFQVNNLSDVLIKDLINTDINMLDVIAGSLSRFIRNSMDVDTVINEQTFGGYFTYSGIINSIDRISIEDKEIIGKTILISSVIELKQELSVFLYNPIYNTIEDKYEFYGDQEVEFVLAVSFEVNLDEEISSVECDIISVSSLV